MQYAYTPTLSIYIMILDLAGSVMKQGEGKHVNPCLVLFQPRKTRP